MTPTLPWSVNLGMLFTEHPAHERPAAARAAGFGAVEIRWPFDVTLPADADVDRFVAAVGEVDVEVVGLSCFTGDRAAGERGFASWPGREQEFRDHVTVVAEIGRRLGCRAFNTMYGCRMPGVSPDEQDDLAVEQYAFASRTFGEVGGFAMLEPMSGHEHYPLRTSDDIVGVIERVERETGETNLRILADLFHLVANGDDIDRMIANHTRNIGHVQIADSPGRHEPGTGDLPLQRWMHDLRAAGYTGWFGLEYQPTTDTLASLSGLSALE